MDVFGRLAEGVARAAERKGTAVLVLLALSLAVYLPGALLLPPVDRTEVIWAETTRDMVARGDWSDPRYGDTVHAFRPVGTFWAQGIAATLAGAGNAQDIRVYRAPSLVAVTLAVIALYLLSAPLVGGFAAFTAASLFAVAPLTVLVSQLAIAEGLSLLPAVVAMLALLRLYVDDEGREPVAIALLFWAAVGLGMLINAALVPILVAATLSALFAFDRDLAWLKRLRPLLGVPIALVIAAPWLVVRAGQDGGVPFAGMSFADMIEALGGAQDMKLRAMPGTFVLALLLGFLPGTALLIPAARRLWSGRAEKLARFLIAWVLGYLVYLELLSSKPGTYMVQTMFPALALAVSLLVRDHAEGSAAPKFHAFPWPIVAMIGAVALFAAVYLFAAEPPSFAAVAAVALVAVLFAISAADGRAGSLRRWAVSGTLALGAFAVALLAVVLPGIGKLWPARQIARYVEASCDPGLSLAVLGLREPSARFLLGAEAARATPDSIAADPPSLAIVEDRWSDRYATALAARGRTPGALYGCVEAYNVMRGCPLLFRVFGHGANDQCFDSKAETCNRLETVRPASKACD